MAWFKTLNNSDTTDMYTLMSAANSISDNIFMPIMLLVIFLVATIGSILTGKPIHRALVYSSFICSILSILMVIMSWLATTYMYFAFLMLAVSLIWTRLSEAYS